ncbi:unnamed protein product [Adineta ricciae]|uniref:F-box domain-containing protein n=1 Tax=Adineta ricciae TaxID=249248 RepID=A0A815G348_ADIRI|nr:unnamed protein product [Adineta ricciae]
MESLDAFRHSWQKEISREKSTSAPVASDHSQAPAGDLCRLGANYKNLSEHQTTIPPVSQSNPSSRTAPSHTSFTIGIGTFIATSTAVLSVNKSCSIEPPVPKKLKTAHSTLLDELIRDIDESTDVPFFNVSLPREIALQIFDHLSIKDLYSCLQVCRAWHSLSCDELLWYNIYKQLDDDKPVRKRDDTWKNCVKEAVLFSRQLVQNFKNHQCRTTKLTYRLGKVLTCANNNSTTIVAGYSTGTIRTWSIEAILSEHTCGGDDDNDTQLDTPDIIYESTDVNQLTDISSVKSVGFLKNDIYAVHDDGLLEVWTKDVGDQPRYTQQLTSLPSVDISNTDDLLCTASQSRFNVWNFQKPDVMPEFQELNFFTDLNDSILSQCISSHHFIPIAVIAGKKSLWCVSLLNLSHRLSFYSTLACNSMQKVSLDIHNEAPLAIIGVENEIKLFDLQSARCNIIATNYKHLPANVHLIQADKCPRNEFLVAYDNAQISIFDQRQKDGAVQHFYNHFATITTLQMDTWKLSSSDSRGFVRLWDRRMHPHSLWHMNPQPHPVTYCSFDKQTLICALTPLCKRPDMIEYEFNSDPLSGHIYVCDFNSDISTKLDDDLKICTSTYDAPKASNRRIGLHTPYDIIQ